MKVGLEWPAPNTHEGLLAADGCLALHERAEWDGINAIELIGSRQMLVLSASCGLGAQSPMQPNQGSFSIDRRVVDLKSGNRYVSRLL